VRSKSTGPERAILRDPGPGHCVVLDCYVSPAPASQAPTSDREFLCALERDASSSIVVFARDKKPLDADRLALQHAMLDGMVAAEGWRIESGYRSTAFVVDRDSGVRGMIELVPAGADI